MRLVSFGQVQCKHGRDCMLELCAGRHRRSLRRHSVHLVCLGYVCRDLRCVGLLQLRRGHLLQCGCVELRGLYRGHLRSGDVVRVHELPRGSLQRGELDIVHGMQRR